MIKRFLALVLVLMTALNIHAQSLDGTWSLLLRDSQIIFIFNDGKYEMKVSVFQIAPKVAKHDFTISIPGTYAREGNAISISTNPEKAKLEVNNVVFVGDYAKKALDPQVKKQMLEELRQIHEKEKEEFLKVYTRNPQYTIISHMNSVLMLETPKGELWSFTRID